MSGNFLKARRATGVKKLQNRWKVDRNAPDWGFYVGLLFEVC